MELLHDRRIRLDASDQRLLRDLAAVEPGEVVTLDQIRDYVERVEEGSQTHVYANMMRQLMRNFLEEAETLAGNPALVGQGRRH